MILNGDFCRIPFPTDDKDEKISAQILLESAFDDTFSPFQNAVSIEKLWSMNKKATRVAFISSEKFNIFHIKARTSRWVHLSEKFGEAINIDYHPSEESILTSHKSGMIRIHSNFTKQDESISSLRDHWHSPDQPTMGKGFDMTQL